MSAYNNAGPEAGLLRLQEQCPRCGGPSEIEETQRLFTCGFCRTRLFISPGKGEEFFRYALMHNAPSGPEIIYAPYWRMRGTLYTIVPYDVEAAAVDHNITALPLDYLPENIGFRAQTIKSRFASTLSSSTACRFMPFSVEKEELIKKIMSVAAAFDTSHVFMRDMIGETMSMVYAPFYVKGRAIYDAVSGKIIASRTLMRADELDSADKYAGPDVSFSPALCPGCGWDLEGHPSSIILMCRNCQSAWAGGGAGFSRLDYGVQSAPGNHDKNGPHYLPFWRIGAKIEGMALDSYLDLIKLAALPRAPRPEWESVKMHFFTPAFRCSPQLSMRLGRQLTVLQEPGEPFEDKELKSGISAPISVTLNEAAESMRITLAKMCAPRNRYYPMLPDIKLSAASSKLVLMPFRKEINEYVHCVYGFGIPGNALRPE